LAGRQSDNPVETCANPTPRGVESQSSSSSCTTPVIADITDEGRVDEVQHRR
jgi:hypothetical protein